MEKLVAVVMLIVGLTATLYAQPWTPDANTMALWHFDESPGTYTAIDATGNGYDMILSDGAEFTTNGFFSGGADLSDLDAKITDCSTLGNGWTALTIDAYIYLTEINNQHPIVSRTDFYNIDEVSYYFEVRANGEIAGGVWLNDVGTQYTDVVSANGMIQPNHRYRVALTWESGQPAKIYVDDMETPVAVSAQSPTGYIRYSSDPLSLGYNLYQIYGYFYLQGFMDEVRISNINRYPSTEQPPFQPDSNTMALWHFDEEIGTYIAHDASGHGCSLTLQDGAEFCDRGPYGNCVDLRDPDAKIVSGYTIGNGWTAMTIDAFIYLNELGAQQPIVSRTDFWNIDAVSFEFAVYDNGEIGGAVWLNGVGTQESAIMSDPNIIQPERWYHVALTWQSGEPTRIWVDDMEHPVAQSTNSPTGYIRYSDNPLSIGFNWYQIYGYFYLQGYMDEIRISNVVRYPESAVEKISANLPPDRFSLHPAYPNPFNPVTTIGFDLGRPTQVSLMVYDILGHEVGRLKDGWLEQGSYRTVFDGRNLATGTYFVRLNTGNVIQTQKIILIK